MVQTAAAKKMTPQEEATAHLAAIVDSSDDAILSKTLDGVITSWNRGAERLYGYAAQEVVGRKISVLIPGERLEELRQVMDRIMGGERVEHLETERLTKDGRQIWVSLTMSPILGPDGGIVGVSTIGRDIGERRQMERLLRESEKRYRTLVELAPDAVVVHQDGRFVYANCAALGIYGATSLEQLQRIPMLDLVHPEERDAAKGRIQQLLEGEEIPLREFRLLRIDGREVDVETSSTLIDYHGRPSIQVIARDISVRKRIEREREQMLQELSFQRARFETVVRQLPLGVMIAEAPSGRLIYDNEQSKRIFRHESQPAEGLADYGRWKIYRPDGSALPIEEYPLARAVRGETMVGEEFMIGRGDGSLGFVSVTTTPIRDSVGQIVSGLAAFHDVTQSKAAAKALADSEESLKLALDAAEMGFCDMDAASGKGVWSRRHFLVLGYTPPADGAGEANSELWRSLIYPDDLARVVQELAQAKNQGSLFRSEHRVFRADNRQIVWVNVQGRYICDLAAATCRFIGVIFDVSERKASEEALRASESTLKLAIETTGLGIFDLDLRTGKGFWSEIAKRHYGLPPAAEANLDILLEAVHPEDRQLLEQIVRDASNPDAAGFFRAEYRTIGIQDGKLRWLTMRARNSCDERGGAVRLIGACMDISEIVRAENALKEEIIERLRAVEELGRQEQLLIRQGRMAAMGEMIGNIAHQWRQPLNTLGLIVQELPRYYERDLLSKEYLDASVTRAMQVINYMSKTIDGFRNFFGPDKEKEPFCASEVLARTISIVEAAFNELQLKIEVLADPEIVIFGCPNEYSQVVLNILVNAKDAILERSIAQPKLAVRLFREDGKAVLTIADNAGGVAPEIMDKIFDPYFTTKEPDKGTGIGLFMSKTIIEKNMNGMLSVRNTEDGAEFRIEV